METMNSPVQEMFGVRPKLAWFSPRVRFPEKPKTHEALKLKLMDPFN